jgi:DNA-binding MarR family transcriptional regulator
MPAFATTDDAAAVADALHSAAIHLLRRARRADEQTGVTPARLSALSVLVFGGPIRLTDLARAEQVKAPTMTRIVAGLEAQKLVRRRMVAGDARAATLHATPRGVRVMHAARRRRVAWIADSLKTLGDSDLRIVRDATAIIERVSRHA